MGYESKIIIFGLKMLIKIGLFRKNYFEIPPCEKLISLTSEKGSFLPKMTNSVHSYHKNYMEGFKKKISCGIG